MVERWWKRPIKTSNRRKGSLKRVIFVQQIVKTLDKKSANNGGSQPFQVVGVAENTLSFLIFDARGKKQLLRSIADYVISLVIVPTTINNFIETF
jgi:hypothetical protein